MCQFKLHLFNETTFIFLVAGMLFSLIIKRHFFLLKKSFIISSPHNSSLHIASDKSDTNYSFLVFHNPLKIVPFPQYKH